uniref:Glutaredoxin-1 n=1 Tax=Pelusios castaneus TaxID=367368 RepID=A0A8C8SCJ9_9SAUR
MAQEFVKSKIRPDKVAVFIKPTCPYCQSAVELLDKYRFKEGHLEFIDITTRDTNSIQDYFQQTTGARTVAVVCICGVIDTINLIDPNSQRSGFLELFLLGENMDE